jgi:hypothetical protein
MCDPQRLLPPASLQYRCISSKIRVLELKFCRNRKHLSNRPTASSNSGKFTMKKLFLWPVVGMGWYRLRGTAGTPRKPKIEGRTCGETVTRNVDVSDQGFQ